MALSVEQQKEYERIKSKTKVDLMELYLLGDGKGNYYNQLEVADRYFHNAEKEDIVSLVHRANGIEREGAFQTKKGLYRPGCKFEKEYDYRVTRRDIEDFIQKYDPKGSVYYGDTFEDWLIRRAEGRDSDKSAQESGYEEYDAGSTWGADSGQRAAGFGIDRKKALVIVGIVFALMVIYAFRSEIISFFFMLIPIAIIIGIIYLVYKFYRKRKGTENEIEKKPAKNGIKKLMGYVLVFVGLYIIIFIGGYAYIDGASWKDVFILVAIGCIVAGIGVGIKH